MEYAIVKSNKESWDETLYSRDISLHRSS